jgi:cyclopropane-fatty-acyl-phospholipid synthase
VTFRIKDYRAVEEKFDRIVSVGMFEHVGVPHYPAFFRTVARCLKDDGVALIHSIGRSDPPGRTHPFIAKYIFPGGYIPALSEVLPAIERAGLIVTDIQILRLHYARTLAHWRQRFRAHWSRAAEMFSEDFCRMWEFYLAGCEVAFRYQNLMVFQVQVAKKVDALPITPEYIWDSFHTQNTQSPLRKVA